MVKEFKQWVAENTDPYFYHETQREHLWDIAREGLSPMSYGQSFVGDMGEMMHPDMFEPEELEEFPQDDLTPRTYYLPSHPRNSNYGDVLLRFPKVAAANTGFDVDHYTYDTIPSEQIEVFQNNQWIPLLQLEA